MFSVFAIYYEDLQYRLKIREEQYQKLFNQLPAGMLLLDRNKVIITVNQAICQYTVIQKRNLKEQVCLKT
ncbi:MAG: PAS domain-containing protein [Halanaerobium sp.]